MALTQCPRRTGATSLPTRGGWIEIPSRLFQEMGDAGPSPHGEGGLKSALLQHHGPTTSSLPTRGGWIETEMLSTRNTYKIVILNRYICSVYINSQAISFRNAMIPSTELKLRRGSYYL